eukprot:gnl/TRDRNA2_/TRDRNA2_157689_c0_seq2.p1 gnl/TRDRNA2_/TRDRNA2_157689_c0~~gnl/TRDRNA2_/TRDRNA2_157689_c0_seq2.p1  ORF type:complete len:387 (-),score=77.32 gnl/TRDRNA2_/TRDRNA2_157689_c0_seq2:39-1199(-)
MPEKVIPLDEDEADNSKPSKGISFNGGKKGKTNAAIDQRVKTAMKRAQTNISSMAKVKDSSIDEFEIEVFIKAKLLEWDKDQTGQYSAEEVAAAMNELKEVQGALANLKWQLIGGAGIATFGMVVAIFVAFIAYSVSQVTTVGDRGDMRAAGGSKGVTVKTTPSREDMFSLQEALLYNEAANETSRYWRVSDNVLRDLQTVSFTTANDTFYQLEIAEIIRTDAAIVSTESSLGDKLEITTAGGHRIRVWELTGDMEVKFLGGYWEILESEDEQRRLQDEDDEDPEWDEVSDPGDLWQPPVARRTKGSGGSSYRTTVVACVGCHTMSVDRRRQVPRQHHDECPEWCYHEDMYDYICCRDIRPHHSLGMRASPWLILPSLFLRCLQRI